MTFRTSCIIGVLAGVTTIGFGQAVPDYNSFLNAQVTGVTITQNGNSLTVSLDAIINNNDPYFTTTGSNPISGQITGIDGLYLLNQSGLGTISSSSAPTGWSFNENGLDEVAGWKGSYGKNNGSDYIHNGGSASFSASDLSKTNYFGLEVRDSSGTYHVLDVPSQPQVAPEPANVAIGLVAGFAGLFAIRRRLR